MLTICWRGSRFAAGSIVAANYLYTQAPRDGIGTVAQALDRPRQLGGQVRASREDPVPTRCDRHERSLSSSNPPTGQLVPDGAAKRQREVAALKRSLKASPTTSTPAERRAEAADIARAARART